MSGVTVRYIGSGPYCYANSLAMMLGSAAPEPAVIEVLTGSPFGAELIGGVMPFFDPLGWDPGIGLDAAIDLLGWTCRRSAAGSDTDAAARLREASASRPLLAGPVEFGLLLHHAETGLEPWQHSHLGYFAIRVGTRRLADAATCLAFIGENKGAGIADEQARLVGAVQHPLVTGDRITVAWLLRRLAPMYEQLRASLLGG